MFMRELLSIEIILESIHEVSGAKGTVRMILFHGEAKSDYFKGRVLPGGVDTQRQPVGGRNYLSARYMLEGTDMDGKNCHIFIENNGADLENGESLETTPDIVTDSEALKWMEKAKLRGVLAEEDHVLKVKIYELYGGGAE